MKLIGRLLRGRRRHKEVQQAKYDESPVVVSARKISKPELDAESENEETTGDVSDEHSVEVRHHSNKSSHEQSPSQSPPDSQSGPVYPITASFKASTSNPKIVLDVTDDSIQSSLVEQKWERTYSNDVMYVDDQHDGDILTVMTKRDEEEQINAPKRYDASAAKIVDKLPPESEEKVVVTPLTKGEKQKLFMSELYTLSNQHLATIMSLPSDDPTIVGTEVGTLEGNVTVTEPKCPAMAHHRSVEAYLQHVITHSPLVHIHQIVDRCGDCGASTDSLDPMDMVTYSEQSASWRYSTASARDNEALRRIYGNDEGAIFVDGDDGESECISTLQDDSLNRAFADMKKEDAALGDEGDEESDEDIENINRLLRPPCGLFTFRSSDRKRKSSNVVSHQSKPQQQHCDFDDTSTISTRMSLDL